MFHHIQRQGRDKRADQGTAMWSRQLRRMRKTDIGLEVYDRVRHTHVTCRHNISHDEKEEGFG
jgi:hypothetical protein